MLILDVLFRYILFLIIVLNFCSCHKITKKLFKDEIILDGNKKPDEFNYKWININEKTCGFETSIKVNKIINEKKFSSEFALLIKNKNTKERINFEVENLNSPEQGLKIAFRSKLKRNSEEIEGGIINNEYNCIKVIWNNGFYNFYVNDKLLKQYPFFFKPDQVILSTRNTITSFKDIYLLETDKRLKIKEIETPDFENIRRNLAKKPNTYNFNEIYSLPFATHCSYDFKIPINRNEITFNLMILKENLKNRWGTDWVPAFDFKIVSDKKNEKGEDDLKSRKVLRFFKYSSKPYYQAKFWHKGGTAEAIEKIDSKKFDVQVGKKLNFVTKWQDNKITFYLNGEKVIGSNLDFEPKILRLHVISCDLLAEDLEFK